MDTVPRGMQLSEPIVPRKWILIESHLDLSPRGEVVYSGNISTYERGEVPVNATYYYGKSGGGNMGVLLYSKGPGMSFALNVQFQPDRSKFQSDTGNNSYSRQHRQRRNLRPVWRYSILLIQRHTDQSIGQQHQYPRRGQERRIYGRHQLESLRRSIDDFLGRFESKKTEICC